MTEPDMITWFKGRWAFLSNFYPSPLVWEGIEYATAEAAFNAGKTVDEFQRRVISMAPTPAAAKKLGRSAKLRTGWDGHYRYQVMREVLEAKFMGPGPEAALLSTGKAYLIEGNFWHDNHWGNCSCNREACREPGRNYLGLMLMELREELRHA